MPDFLRFPATLVMSDVPTHGSVLAFDFGQRRIGVAVGELSLGLAHPLATIDAADNARRFQAIARFCDEWQPVLFVIGLPSHADGQPHEMTRLSERFAARLHETFARPCVLVDERYTSVLAESLLTEAQCFGRKRKPALDQLAAQQILHTYFCVAVNHALT